MAEQDQFESGQPKNFLRPTLLLLLLEGQAHGYDLLERLPMVGLSRIDPGGMYRALRAMEHEGLVHSRWESSGTGPARRVYTITPEGEDQLGAWAVAIEDARATLNLFLERFAQAQAPPRRRR